MALIPEYGRHHSNTLCPYIQYVFWYVLQVIQYFDEIFGSKGIAQVYASKMNYLSAIPSEIREKNQSLVFR